MSEMKIDPRASDPQINKEYLMEMYNNLIEEENNMKPLFGYMKNQTDINEKMRAILIDWIIDVHFKFKLKSDTLFLTVWLIDKYLSEKVIKRKKDIINLECEILKMLKFNVTIPTSNNFYEIISNLLVFNINEFYLGKYLLEMFLLDYRSLQYKPSEIAHTVCFIIMNHRIKNNVKYLDEQAKDFEYDYKNNHDNFKECARDISFLLENLESTQLLSVKKKFMTKACHQVGRLKKIF